MTTSCEFLAKDKEGKTKPEKLQPGGSSKINNVFAILSGKGGVGKSTVTSIIGVTLARKGYKVGILDADITGPSIPKMFGLNIRPDVSKGAILPVMSFLGIKVISLNLLMESEYDPVIWRGPLIAGVVKQFWTDVNWGNLDYLLVDLPPGTGDVPLTVMQSLPLDGLIIVSSPQELAVMVVRKAINMGEMMKANILGLLENMSYLVCTKCGEKLELFGPSKGEKVAETTGIPFLGTLPLDLRLVGLCDAGQVELYYNDHLMDGVIDQLLAFRKEVKEAK